MKNQAIFSSKDKSEMSAAIFVVFFSRLAL